MTDTLKPPAATWTYELAGAEDALPLSNTADVAQATVRQDVSLVSRIRVPGVVLRNPVKRRSGRTAMVAGVADGSGRGRADLEPGWQEASRAVAREMGEWRRAHPKATLAQTEGAVFEAMQRLQARALGQVAHATATSDIVAQASEERPRCPTCGSQLEPRGRQRRSI